jgi:hypothetical protein
VAAPELHKLKTRAPISLIQVDEQLSQREVIAVVMEAPSRYVNICRISLASERFGYEYCAVPAAQEFYQKQFLQREAKQALSNQHTHHRDGEIQAALLSYFHAKKSSADATTRALAGLSLRCRVSYSILIACKKIASIFSGGKSFSYRDLLPFVLNDDGQTLILLDREGKTQLILDESGEAKPAAYKYFAVEILRTFKQDSKSSMSLANWAYLLTKQNPELKDFLSDFGFKHLSDWALLNRARPKQLELLSVRQRHLAEIFHAVYRRDRRQQQKGERRCPDPSAAQLKEMLAGLQERGVATSTPVELVKELKQVATQLRQYDIWSYREPLEIYDPETGDSAPRPDLPHDSLSKLDVEHVEQRELQEFLHEQLKLALAQAIEREIASRLTHLQKSKRYATIAANFLPGLQLYYGQGMSLREIAPLLGMTSWDQARRVLNPRDLLNKVRERTVQQFLDRTLEKAQGMGLTKIPPEPDYLKNLAEQIEAFADREIFQEAAEEIRAGKSRSMNSFYAQQLRLYFEKRT